MFDFSEGSYANGDYAGAVFSELGGAGGAGGAAALDAAAGGAVTVARELTEPGYYAVTVLAASPEGAGFVGTARLTLSLTLSRAIDLDEAVWPRVIVTAAARGFYGRGASFSVSAGYVVENPDYDSPANQFAYDDSSRTFVIPASSPLGVLAVTAAVTAEVGCAREEDLCDVRAVTVTAIFNPVADPGQGTVTAIYGESFGRAARLPADYETGGRFALLGVGGVDAAALSAISLRVDSSGGLTLDVAGGVGGALSAGTVTATIGMTHPDFLGTVALRTRLEILPADPGPLYTLSAAERNPGVVTVAAGWLGVAHRAELGAAAAGGGIVLPAESPRNVSLALSGDGRTVSFALSSPLDGGAEFAETVRLTVTRNDLNYYDIGQTVELRVSALAVPAAVNQDGEGSLTNPFRSANLHDFAQGVYAGAVFGKKSGANELRVSESGVVSVIPAGIGTSGSYRIVITATSGAFLGAAEFEFALQVGALGGLPGSYGVPPTARTERRKVAAGYTGSVAFFAASTVGVSLRTPDSAPAGFDFDTGADFVSPGGFAVSLTLALSAGGAIGGAFEVTGQYAGYSDATIPLSVTIEALASPPAADTGGARVAPVSGGIFDFAHSNYADGVYQGASFRAGGGASADLTVSKNGQVETARDLGAGIYEITVLADSSPNYLGTATLSLALTVRWVLEYGVGSGGGGEVRAVDGAGDALDSGALLAAGALVTFRAVPLGTYYVSGWTGACGDGIFSGEVGDADNPGAEKECAATAGDHLRVSAIFSPIPIAEGDGIAIENQAADVSVAAGYAGSVAFFAGEAGVTLRTPVSAPEGFDFDKSADFAAPDGFAVSLTTILRPGGEISGDFEVAASRGGYAETTISLAVTVRALPAAASPVVGIKTGPFSGDVFDFSRSDYAGGVYQNASFGEGGVLSPDLSVSARGQVSTARDLGAGIYGVTVLAESPSEYLGTATLSLALTVRWVLEYGVGSGGGGEVRAVDGAGDALDSGALLAAGALVTFRAVPLGTYYVSGWTGACGDGTGKVGDADNPGAEKECAATAGDHLRVSAIFSPIPIAEGDGIAIENQAADVSVAAGYAGSVAFFAGEAGVTLRTPASAPEGFDFDKSADFASPDGFAVSLTTILRPGGEISGDFEVVASRGGYAETTISLAVTVRALPAAASPVVGIKTGPFSGDVFDFSRSDYAEGRLPERKFRRRRGFVAGLVGERGGTGFDGA